VLLSNWHNCDLYFVGLKKPSSNHGSIPRLREALQSRFRPAHSFRSLCTYLAAKPFGEHGVGVLRAIWRLLPR
jgi:hypothetical protein